MRQWDRLIVFTLLDSGHSLTHSWRFAANVLWSWSTVNHKKLMMELSIAWLLHKHFSSLQWFPVAKCQEKCCKQWFSSCRIHSSRIESKSDMPRSNTSDVCCLQIDIFYYSTFSTILLNWDHLTPVYVMCVNIIIVTIKYFSLTHCNTPSILHFFLLSVYNSPPAHNASLLL